MFIKIIILFLTLNIILNFSYFQKKQLNEINTLTQDNYIEEEEDIFKVNEHNIIAELPKHNVKMYYKEYDKKNYFYRDFIVKMNNNMRYFHWENVSNKTFAPKLFVSDLDNDGLDELIIELCTGHGTGLYSGEIHVLKQDHENNTLNEVLVESPLILLHKNVKARDNLEYLELLIEDKTITINKDDYPYSPSSDVTIYFGEENLRYEVINNTLYAFVKISSHGVFLGELVVSYIFKDYIYQMKYIDYIPHNYYETID